MNLSTCQILGTQMCELWCWYKVLDQKHGPGDSRTWSKCSLSVHIWTLTNFLSLIKVPLPCLLCLYLWYRSASSTAGCSVYILCSLAPWGISPQWNAVLTVLSRCCRRARAKLWWRLRCAVKIRSICQTQKHIRRLHNCLPLASISASIALEMTELYWFVLWAYAGSWFRWCLRESNNNCSLKRFLFVSLVVHIVVILQAWFFWPPLCFHQLERFLFQF